MSNIIKLRGVMASLFKDEKAKEIINTFEAALEKYYGSDSHYAYDVNLEKYLNSNYIKYTHDKIDSAFEIYLHTLNYLPSSLYNYLYDGDVEEELFNQFYNN